MHDLHSLLIQHIGRRVQLGPQQEEQLRDAFTVKELPARQYLLQHGEVCRHESFVCTGLLRSFHFDGQGNEHTLHFAVEDWWITDLPSFLQQKPATRNIVAMEPVQVLQIAYKRREELLNDPVFERFWRMLNERASAAQEERILFDIMMTGAEKYAALLEKYPGIDQRIPQKFIASYLGITPVFLSKIRKQRSKAGK
jgi:CRP-like cAMP-binding protein